ncbi:eukaryotic translation initiation factor 2B subunit gamma isoform X2 [Lasioglossum baleicum]
MSLYKEFQAVVLAGGGGSRMTELTQGQCKCLLPIGNIPMLWYPLQLLEYAGFKEAIVVVSENIGNNVSLALKKLNLKINVDIVPVEDAEDLGTADSIRLIHEKIHTDFLVISCDLISNVDICEVLNLYRKHNASIVALMLPVPKLPPSDDFVTPGPKNKQMPETDLIGIDNETGRLVFLASASDFEETINISQMLLKKCISFTIHSKLLDAHLYVMSKWVLDYLVHNKTFSALKGELLPHIVRNQLTKPPKQFTEDKNTSIVQFNSKKDIHGFANEKPLDDLIRKMSAYNDHNTDLEDVYDGDIVRCYAHIASGKFGIRVNTIQMYHFANTKISQLWTCHEIKESNVPRISASATINTTQILDCCVDDNATVYEKTFLKQCHIGPNAVIESKTRVSNSVIMENVTIKQRCVIQNCILCSDCVIEEGAVLQDCVVGPEHVVAGHHSHEVLTDTDRLIEI